MAERVRCLPTYFQQVGGPECKAGDREITYGLERLAMYTERHAAPTICLERAPGWVKPPTATCSIRTKWEQSTRITLNTPDVDFPFSCFEQYEKASSRLAGAGKPSLPLPAYDAAELLKPPIASTCWMRVKLSPSPNVSATFCVFAPLTKVVRVYELPVKPPVSMCNKDK